MPTSCIIIKNQDLIAILVEESEKPIWFQKDCIDTFIYRESDVAKLKSLPPSKVSDYWNNRPEIAAAQAKSPQEYYNNIPTHNDTFVGRVEELKKLHKILTAVPNKIPIVCGEAGVGKTELLKQYSRIYKTEYQTIIELDAAKKQSIPEIIQSIIDNSVWVAKYDLFSCRKDHRVITRCRNILQKLAESGDEILICVNDITSTSVLSCSEVNEYFRGKESIHICATSRITGWAFNDTDSISPLKITGLPAEDGIKLLERKCPVANINERKAVGELWEYFDGNAWALDLLGEMLKQNGCPKNAYTEMLKNIKNSPLKKIASDGLMKKIVISHRCNNFKEIFDISMDSIGWAAGRMAHIAAMGDPNHICIDLIKKVFSVCHRKFESEDEFNDAVKMLQEWNILIADKEQSTFRMSNFTQFALKQRMGDNYYELRKTLLDELLKVFRLYETQYDGIALLNFKSSQSFARICGLGNGTLLNAPQVFQIFHSIEAPPTSAKTKNDVEDLFSNIWNTVEKIAKWTNSRSSTCWLQVVYFFLPLLLMEKTCKTEQTKFSEFLELCLEKISNIDEIFIQHKQKLTQKSMELLMILHHIAIDIIAQKKVTDKYYQYAAKWYIHMLVLLKRSPQKEKKEILEILNYFECETGFWRDEFNFHQELMKKKAELRELLLTHSPPGSVQK